MLKLDAEIWQEEDVWCASVPALPGCFSWGENYEHAIQMITEAAQGWLLTANEIHKKNISNSNHKIVEIAI